MVCHNQQLDIAPITTSGDKLAVMKYLLGRWKTAQRSLEPDRIELENPRTAYIGDSLTDIECLLEAEVGIIMVSEGKASRLKEVLERNGVAVKHVSEYMTQLAEGQLEAKWWARDFLEISQSNILELQTG